MIWDDDGFENDPCWDCPYWKGVCSKPQDVICPDE